MCVLWMNLITAIFAVLLIHSKAGNILDLAQAARIKRMNSLEWSGIRYIPRAERHYLVSYSAHTDITMDDIRSHIDKLFVKYGETVFLGEITHHSLWAGFSIAIDKKKAYELGGRAAKMLDAVSGDGAFSRVHERNILQHIRTLPFVKSVHKVRKMSASLEGSDRISVKSRVAAAVEGNDDGEGDDFVVGNGSSRDGEGMGGSDDGGSMDVGAGAIGNDDGISGGEPTDDEGNDGEGDVPDDDGSPDINEGDPPSPAPLTSTLFRNLKSSTSEGTSIPSAEPALSPIAQRASVRNKGRNSHWFPRNPQQPVPWGLDRIDQTRLPLDQSYSPQFNGSRVNVFVVDTGLDTKHIEFSNTIQQNGKIIQINDRQVANIFDIYVADESDKDFASVQQRQEMALYPSGNNDAVGHGTHVAATIGGNTVGVSPGCNLYGVRVLGGTGSGSDEDIILGLLFVYDVYIDAGSPPSVINMSLGGSCNSYEECSEDALVGTVEKLAEAGLNVVVAAGNSGCDACLETPAFASQAITVGAIDIHDNAASFSDNGKCIDIYAPGVNITSACASASCAGRQDQYVTLSGTSMATPHVVGVIAQILELDTTLLMNQLAALEEMGITPPPDYGLINADTLAKELACSATKGVISLLRGEDAGNDNVSRNLLLHVPIVDLTSDGEQLVEITAANSNLVCNLGEGCANYSYCSGNGYCQNGECLCNTGVWGDRCDSTELGFSCSQGLQYVPYTLFDLAGTGENWDGTQFRIQGPHTRPTLNIPATKWDQFSPNELSANLSGHYLAGTRENAIPVLTTNMCDGDTEVSGMCLQTTVQHAGGKERTHFTFNNSAVTIDAQGTFVYSYSMDVEPAHVVSGFAATWEMCGRRGGAPARWEVLVYNPTDSAVHHNSTNIHRNANDNYGDASTDDAWRAGAPKALFASNASYCELQCADHSVPVEIRLYLQNPWAPEDTAGDSLVLKTVEIGSHAAILQNGSPRPGTNSVPVGYSLVDVRSGLELGGGSWIMTDEVSAFLDRYMEVYFNDVDTPTHKDLLKQLNNEFPLQQVQSFCATSALLHAANDVARQTADVTTPPSLSLSVDIALITFGAPSLRASLAFELCGVHVPAITSSSLFRFTFTRNSFSSAYETYSCAFVDDTGREVQPSSAAPTVQPTAAPTETPPTQNSMAQGTNLTMDVTSRSLNIRHDTNPAAAFSSRPEERTVKMAIMNVVPSNFTVPITMDISGTSSQKSNQRTDWGWYRASYVIEPVRPSPLPEQPYLPSVANCVQKLLINVSSDIMADARQYSQQCVHPLMVNTSLHNGIMGAPVQDWRVRIASDPSKIAQSPPTGALPFYVTCGVQASFSASGLKFKEHALGSGNIDSAWQSLPSAPVPASSAGVLCERECVSVSAAYGDGTAVVEELSDSVKPMLIVRGLSALPLSNPVSSGNSSHTERMELQKLIGLVSRNQLCIGDAANGIAEGAQTCTSLLFGAGTQSQLPLWDLGGCNFAHGYVSAGPSIDAFHSSDRRQLFPSTSIVDVCVTDWTDCRITAVFTPDCTEDGMARAAAIAQGNEARDTRVYMFPPSRQSPFPSLSSAPVEGDTNDIHDVQETLSLAVEPRHGFYLFLFGAKGTWQGAEFALYKAPSLGPDALKGYALHKLSDRRHGRAHVVGMMGGSNFTVYDDDAHPLGSDDDPFLSRVSRHLPFDLVTSGSLENGQESGVAALCLTNGCYMLDVTRGNITAKGKAEKLFVLCGKVGTVGEGAYVGVHDGECTVYPDILSCQLQDTYFSLAQNLWILSAASASIALLIAVALLWFCMRRAYPAKSQTQLYQLLSDGSCHPVITSTATTNRIHGETFDDFDMEMARPYRGGHEGAQLGLGATVQAPFHRQQLELRRNAEDNEIELTSPVPSRTVAQGLSPILYASQRLSPNSVSIDDIDALGFDEVSFSAAPMDNDEFNPFGTESKESLQLDLQQRMANLSAGLSKTK